MELIFECHNYYEENKARVVIIEFTDYINIWCNQLVINKRRNHKKPIETREKMKTILRMWFIPCHYYKDLYQKL